MFLRLTKKRQGAFAAYLFSQGLCNGRDYGVRRYKRKLRARTANAGFFLQSALPGLKSVVLNISKNKTNVILGEKTKLLWGSEK